MSDQEQRAEEHKDYIAHKHRPRSILCDQCTKLLAAQNIVEDYRGTGWNVCTFCIESIPDFVSEVIESLEKKIVELGGEYE